MKTSLAILILFLFLTGIFWLWWFPGPRVAVDFPWIPNQHLHSLFDFPRLWMERDVEGLGEYTVFTLWSWPFSVVLGLLAKAGLGFSVLERILWILPFMVMGIVSIWQLLRDFQVMNSVRLIASFFYLTNTYVLLLIDGGQISIALAYALFPICFLAIKKSFYDSLRYKIIAGFAVALLGIFDFRFIYILLLLSLTYLLYLSLFAKSKIRLLVSGVSSALVIGILLTGINSYWILPILKAPLSTAVIQQLTATPFTSFSNIGNGLLMLAPHWYKNVFGQVTLLRWEFILIPLLAFLAPILKPRNQEVGFWLFVAIISIFLAKGSNEPFPQVYPWLYFHLPGFSLFRDSTKFFFLIGLSFSILMAISLEEIYRKFLSIKKANFFLTVFLFVYLFILIRPVWSNQMTGTFSIFPQQGEYQAFKNILENDREFGRVFWIPTKAPLGYYDFLHPAVEASRFSRVRPFLVGTVGTYEVFNFLREANYMKEIFDIAGIGYIAYPMPDSRRENDFENKLNYYHLFSGQLTNLDWLSLVKYDGIPLLKTRQHQDRFFAVDNSWWVVGSDDLYKGLSANGSLKLSKNAFIFVEEYPGLGQMIDNFPNTNIILNDKSQTDLVASFLSPSQIIFPANFLDLQPNESGWWKRNSNDFLQWRDFLQTKYRLDNQDFDYGGGWAISEGNHKLEVSIPQDFRERVLLARIMKSSRGGELSFYQKNNLIGSVSTKLENPPHSVIKLTGSNEIPDRLFEFDKTNIVWVEVGNLLDNEKLTIKTSGDINIVNSLAVVQRQDWNGLKEKAKLLAAGGRISEYSQVEKYTSKPEIKYQQIDPTKYSVRVNNLSHPTFLIFSERYNPNWHIGTKRSVPVYSLLNGFWIDGNGTYYIEYKPQQWVAPGLTVSAITLILAMGILIYQKKRGNIN